MLPEERQAAVKEVGALNETIARCVFDVRENKRKIEAFVAEVAKLEVEDALIADEVRSVQRADLVKLEHWRTARALLDQHRCSLEVRRQQLSICRTLVLRRGRERETAIALRSKIQASLDELAPIVIFPRKEVGGGGDKDVSPGPTA